MRDGTIVSRSGPQELRVSHSFSRVGGKTSFSEGMRQSRQVLQGQEGRKILFQNILTWTERDFESGENGDNFGLWSDWVVVDVERSHAWAKF